MEASRPGLQNEEGNWVVYDDSTILVVVSATDAKAKSWTARLLPYEYGYPAVIDSDEWEPWLFDPEYELEIALPLPGIFRWVQEARPRLRAALPSEASVGALIDWDWARAHLEAKALEREARWQEARERERVLLLKLEAIWRTMAANLAAGRLECPHCGARTSFRSLDHGPVSDWYFVCLTCARSFGPKVTS